MYLSHEENLSFRYELHSGSKDRQTRRKTQVSIIQIQQNKTESKSSDGSIGKGKTCIKQEGNKLDRQGKGKSGKSNRSTHKMLKTFGL